MKFWYGIGLFSILVFIQAVMGFGVYYAATHPKPTPLPANLLSAEDLPKLGYLKQEETDTLYARKDDLGDMDYKSLAIEFVKKDATNAGLRVIEAKAVKVAGVSHHKVVTIRLKLDIGDFVVRVKMTRSLWRVENLDIKVA